MIERKTLSQFIKEIQSLDFIQIHKSYIINKRFIQEIKNQEVILKNKHIFLLEEAIKKV